MDFLAKPVDPDHLLLMVERAIAQRRMLTEYILLKEELAERRGAPRIIGEDRQAPAGARSSCTGRRPPTPRCCSKARAARARSCSRARCTRSARAPTGRSSPSTARRSRTRCSRPSCSATRRARSPAPSARKPGRFEMAHRGTLFLDEIGDLPLALQAKILRALEEKRFERVGGTQSLHVDVRVVAATNRNLKAQRGRRASSARICTSGSRCSRSRFRRCASAHDDVADPGAALRRAVLPRAEQEAAAAVAGGARRAAGLRVAGQRPRAAELHRARGDPLRRRHDPAPPSEPVVPPARTAAPVPAAPRGKQIDLSGTLTEALRRVTAEVERRKLEQALREAAGNKQRAADALQISYKTLLQKHEGVRDRDEAKRSLQPETLEHRRATRLPSRRPPSSSRRSRSR